MTDQSIPGATPRTTPKAKPNPQKVAFLRQLPQEIKEQITGEEAQAFIFDQEVPDSMLDKLKDYLVDDE